MEQAIANTRIDWNFLFTRKAVDAIASHEGHQIAFQSVGVPSLELGDHFSMEELMPHVFVVVRRHFHWVDHEYLQIEFLLDLQEPSDPVDSAQRRNR
jgi:hypothetical protein